MTLPSTRCRWSKSWTFFKKSRNFPKFIHLSFKFQPRRSRNNSAGSLASEREREGVRGGLKGGEKGASFADIGEILAEGAIFHLVFRFWRRRDDWGGLCVSALGSREVGAAECRDGRTRTVFESDSLCSFYTSPPEWIPFPLQKSLKREEPCDIEFPVVISKMYAAYMKRSEPFSGTKMSPKPEPTLVSSPMTAPLYLSVTSNFQSGRSYASAKVLGWIWKRIMNDRGRWWNKNERRHLWFPLGGRGQRKEFSTKAEVVWIILTNLSYKVNISIILILKFISSSDRRRTRRAIPSSY